MSDKKTALIIDDEPDIREVLRVLLESEGFDVDLLSDGIDAVQLTKRYDVILLDWQMPVFDGKSLTDYWQLTEPDILRRVIVLSGYSRLALAQEPPAFAMMAKPFDYIELMTLIEQCIAQSQAASASAGGV